MLGSGQWGGHRHSAGPDSRSSEKIPRSTAGGKAAASARTVASAREGSVAQADYFEGGQRACSQGEEGVILQCRSGAGRVPSAPQHFLALMKPQHLPTNWAVTVQLDTTTGVLILASWLESSTSAPVWQSPVPRSAGEGRGQGQRGWALARPRQRLSSAGEKWF